ncbi:uncharacterized protein LOC143148704 [Ptiloglossa arizonensis]|uniref:uncharacterized protein LOC143148704 n=1 Tax=Ptiloglossa arizonensis TaxID=3350558 RepID=UPI003F9EE290
MEYEKSGNGRKILLIVDNNTMRVEIKRNWTKDDENNDFDLDLNQIVHGDYVLIVTCEQKRSEHHCPLTFTSSGVSEGDSMKEVVIARKRVKEEGESVMPTG